jgi:ribonuclease P protein component
MKKKNIIKSSREYTEIIKTSKYIKNSNFIIYYRKNNDKNRYGISVPTKLGKANIRNKIKRRIKNIIDINEISIQKSYDYVIIIRKGLLELSYQEIEQSILNLLKKIGENNEKK